LSFKIDFHPEAKKALKKIDVKTLSRISRAIEALKEDSKPSNSTKISGVTNETYRIRCGKYRVIYRIQGEKLIILIIRVGLRKDVYRNLN